MEKNISEWTEEDWDIIMFGYPITELYDMKVKDAYNLIKENTNYLDNISLEEVKEIKFSCYKDIIVLLNNGTVFINEDEIIDNVKTLGFMSGLSILAFTNDNRIISLIGNNKNTDYINNNDYKYKKIIVTPLTIIGLTNENTIRVFGMIVDQVIDYTKYMDVDDIGYYEEEDDIVVIKNNKVLSLFNNIDYEDIKYITNAGKYNFTLILEGEEYEI